MDFHRVISGVCGRLDQAGLGYALIGGFAMAMRGVQRATVDLDFLLLLEDMEVADGILLACGYECMFRSDNVSHYQSTESDFGRIDILHAFRGPSLGMLERAERMEVYPGLEVPVLRTEDIIGLKVQAAVNDPQREMQDWVDIRLLLEASAYSGTSIDWLLIQDYLDIFDLNHRMRELQTWYGKAD